MIVNNLLKTLVIGTLVIASFGFQKSDDESWKVSSPDKNLTIKVSKTVDIHRITRLAYTVTILKNGKPSTVIEPSPLGLERKDQQFSENLSIVSKSEEKIIDEKFQMMIGRQRECLNHARQLDLTFKNEKGALTL